MVERLTLISRLDYFQDYRADLELALKLCFLDCLSRIL